MIMRITEEQKNYLISDVLQNEPELMSKILKKVCLD